MAKHELYKHDAEKLLKKRDNQRNLWNEEKIAVFCEVLSKGFSPEKAARAAGMSRSSAYNKREHDEAFRQLWDSAFEAGTDHLEDVALERAQEKSDVLMIVTLKARRPDKYIEKRALEINQNVNITVQKAAEELRAIPREQLLASAALLSAPVIENENASPEAGAIVSDTE